MVEDRQRQLISAQPGSRLEALLASYEAEKAASDEASARFRNVTDAIKAEATHLFPGATALTLAGGPGMPVLAITWVESWRVDTKAMKESDPLTYVRYAKKSGHWELRAL